MSLADILANLPDSTTMAAWGTGITATVTGAYGALKPLRTWVKTTIQEEAVEAAKPLYDQVKSLDGRVSAVETAIAPTNGDRRSISDRVDTTKYTIKVTNDNVKSLAQWLHDINPGSPPPVIHDLPER